MNRYLAVFGCVCAIAALAHSAAVPTQDTMVVAKSDDTIATSTPSVEEVTTEESSPPIKLTEMEVVSEVSLRYAHTTVVARVRNPAKRAQEANFRVLLPETAFISGFVMTLDGKSYKAYVKEKEEAKQIYQNAVSQGIGAAHISAKARDSNHFTVSVNVEPSSNAIFNLTYEELLVRRNGVYNHAINLHPGALVPKLTVTVHIKETEKLIELRVPEIRTGNEIDATKDDAQNSKATIVRAHDDREATITFTPDLQEQERLIQIYTQKSKESAAATHSYSSWSSYSEPEEAAPEGVLGQFVVQYDVARPKDGEILVNDGYFVHFFAPSELPPLSKFVVFVLDTSGSMMDRKIIQLREAMQTILGELNEGDYFSIVEFDSTVTVHDLKEAEGEPPKHHYSYSYFDEQDKKATLVPPSQATKENIDRAKRIVSWLQASGGTNIGKALDVAVDLINKGVDWKTEVTVSGTTETTTSAGPSEAAVTSTTEVAAKKEAKSLEPIIIFLTDGDPTVGETDPKRIITRVQEKNSGPNKATIFSLAFGEDADRKFLRKVSLRNGGFMRHIYEAADAALQLRDFYRQISSPLLADLKFTYPSGQVRSESLTQHSFPTYYAGSELVVAGQVLDVPELQPTVHAFCGVQDGYGRKRVEIVPKVPIEKKKQGYLPLERLWSYLTIKQLLDKRDASDDSDNDDKENSPEKKALALALKYEFVTPLTSLVVVKPNATNAVDAESVDKAAGPLSLSSGALARPMASYGGFGGGVSASAFGSVGAGGFAAPAAVYTGLAGPASSVFARPATFSAFSRTTPLLYASSRPAFSFSSQQGWRTNTFTANTMSVPNGGDMLMVVPRTTTIPPILRPSLADLHLDGYTWLESLLDASASTILLPTNDTTITLKIVKDSVVPKESSGDAECASAVGGGAGVCVYLSRCDSARDITVDVYKTTYCSVSQGYAGVCCQQKKVDIVH
nr:inter-alpha-trypsin inhibitor heavy chain H4 isoform X2 [Helicoverpa armigera]